MRLAAVQALAAFADLLKFGVTFLLRMLAVQIPQPLEALEELIALDASPEQLPRLAYEPKVTLTRGDLLARLQ